MTQRTAAQTVSLYRVRVTAPVSRLPTGPTTSVLVGHPAPGSFAPAAVRVIPAADIRPGDILLGTCQPYYDRRAFQPFTDRAEFVSYFSGTPIPQRQGARVFDANHCDRCWSNAQHRLIAPGSGFTVLDGCTPYPPGALLLAVPRALAAR
ncbi:hypothetical protein [Streptomyces sp. NPDC001889]